MRRKHHPGQIGDYWPSRRPNSPAWCRTWFDRNTRQTRRESLGTEDFDEAFRRLADWYAHNVTLKRAAPQDAKVADLVRRYYEEHARHLPSATSAYRHVKVLLDPDVMTTDWTVSEFSKAAQHDVIDKMRKRGLSDGSVKRYWASMLAAIRWAAENDLITGHGKLVSGLEGGEPRQRVLTIAELAQLWDAADLPHIQTFMMVMLCCMCRTGAALELTRFQCDLQFNLIDMNPPSRKRTKKRRPILPMPAPLRPWIASATGYLVEFEGRPIKSIKTAWKALRRRTGFGLDVEPMTLRHTMATHLAARGVPKFQRESFMGHRAENTTGRNYEHSRPDFLKEAREAIESIVSEMGEAATSPISPINLNVRASCVLAV